MSLRKYKIVLLSFVLLLCVCCGATANKKIRVALVLTGFLGDQSFNDSIYEGVKRAVEEFPIEVKVLQSMLPAEWESNLISVASDGYDLVICASQLKTVINDYAADFPNVRFGLIDAIAEAPNVSSAVFAQNEGSFLAGAAAAMFTAKTNIPGVNTEKIIGWIGGMDIPLIQDFLVGYKQGATYIDPEMTVLVSFAGSFNDPLKGKELALAQYQQGADIVMNVAGTTGNGVLEAAEESGKYAIGVDLNQDNIYPGHILTSMLKRADMGSYLMIKDVVDGKFEGGKVAVMDISNGGVGLTDMAVIKKALGDKFPDDILERIAMLIEEVKCGKVKVDSYEGFKRD